MESKQPLKKEQKNILSVIETIALDAKESGFSAEFLDRNFKVTKPIADMLDCSQIQALLFSIIFNLNFTKSSVDIECMSDYIGCSPISIARHINDLEGLCKKKILRCENNPNNARRRRENALDRASYYVYKEVLDAILNNEKYVPEPDEAADTYELIGKIRAIMYDREKGQLTWEEMEKEIQFILQVNKKLYFVREMNNLKLSLNDQMVFIRICDEFLDGSELTDFIAIITSIFPDFRKQLEIRREFIDGSNDLIRKDLVSLEDGMFRSDRSLSLKDRALDMLLGTDKNAFVKKKETKKSDVILATEVLPKNLFFNQDEENQLDFLTKTLMPGNYERLVQRLNRVGMKSGFCALFHGMPGTGKTESVLQIARKTGRDIKMVVISESKSMWFGESEKRIKNIFDQYRREVEKSKITPILLFNEADGILSTRRKVGDSAIDQTENAIQNILLQEMENLEGILIATTNLSQNLDKAFERRFLYKIYFNKPDQMRRFLIWKQHISGLPLKMMKEVAHKYEFTGGQIDNISRKLIIHEVLNGTPDLAVFQKFCEAEKIDGQGFPKIGFIK